MPRNSTIRKFLANIGLSRQIIRFESNIIDPMVVEFSVENYRSIRDLQTVSFVPDESKHLADNLLFLEQREDMKLLTSLFVYGGNGSGKSNLCRAFGIFRWLAVESARQLTLDDAIPELQPFKLDPETANSPSRFMATFLIGADMWEYSVACDRFRIHDEHLKRKPNSSRARWSTIFSRSGSDRSKWTGNAPRLHGAFFQSVRDNSTILSKAANENIPIVEDVFRAILPIAVRSMASAPRFLVSEVDEFLSEYEPLRGWLSTIVSCADVLFESIEMVTEDVSMHELPSPLRDALESRGARSALVRDLRFMRSRTDGQPVTFELEEISGGTVRFLALVLEIFRAARLGSILVLDEFDASLHPLLAIEVRNLLLDPYITSRSGAQFLLITHNDTLLDSSRIRRDQIILLNQSSRGDTEFYAMTDLDRTPKPGESFQKRYLNGGYGGAPRIGDLKNVFFDMVREWEQSGAETAKA